ncbi:MAG TPA: hydantoinase/oxoprolinase family protein [Solirubrobacteraceae bacterium]|nr:hydantoinase/oxoprolinase family protein [Solirubrobacteraceae bacterium]
MAATSDSYHVGVDIGGTFTDLVAVSTAGQTYRAKSPTTPDDYSQGIADGLDVLAQASGLELSELMGATDLFINGTTVVTNAIAELKGRHVGVIITAGFGDTLRIARSARTNDRDLHTQTPPPDIVRRTDVLEVDERIDFAGREIVALNADQVRQAAQTLVDQHGCDAIAICFLWSFANPAHEQEAKQIVSQRYPDVFVSVSSDVFPVAREYERLVTTVFNAFTSKGVAEYVGALEGRLSELGCAVRPALMQSVGGLLSPEEARGLPIELINSGPVGGVVGARALAERLGLRDVVTADMGGTSFDCALIKDLQLTEAHRAQLGKFATGLSMIDISAIGAGGGSIFWLDARGAPRVGPDSAGAVPGPACYGRGGTEPTVTDVALAMGLMDPEYFLGGSISLDADAARQAITARIADPLSWELDRTLAGLYQIVVDAMSNAVRAISIERGHDPRHFAMVGYGGASGLFVPLICRTMGISELVIPGNAAVFSAYGLLWSDAVRSMVQTVNWIVPAAPLEPVNQVLAGLAEQAREALRARGFAEEAIDVRYEGDFKFAGQAFELTIPLPAGELTDEHRGQLMQDYISTYERLNGPGTSWEGFPIVMLNARVTATAAVPRPQVQEYSPNGGAPEAAVHERRSIVEPESGERVEVDVYRGERLHSGIEIRGPAVIEDVDTTVFVPAGATCRLDEHRYYRMGGL